MKSVTIDQVMAWEPCSDYPRKLVEELAAGRTEITAPEIVSLEIPAEDRLWMLLHNEFLTDAQMYELACRFAEAALKKERDAGSEPDVRSWAAIEAKRKWLNGEITDNELAAAVANARNVARAAASTVEVVAWAATLDDARAAARDAAWAATMDAATAAVLCAARSEHLAMTLAMIYKPTAAAKGEKH